MNNFSVVLLRIFKYLPTLTIGITSACFVIGLLIVNLRLSWYGIYPQEFVRTEYILVGAVFIFLVATVQTSLTYSKNDFVRALEDVKQKRLGRALSNISFGLMTFFSPLAVIFGSVFLNNEYIFSWIALFSILCLILLGQMANIFIEEFTELISNTKTLPEPTNNIQTASANRLLGQIAIMLIFLGGYSNFMYPHIPPAFGGGYKSPIMLHPNEKGLAISKALALPLHENPAVVGPLQLLTESENEIVVLIPDTLTGKNQAVRLKKDLFDAVQTVTPKGHTN